MQISQAVPSVLMALAGLALVTAMWFAVRRPPISSAFARRRSWQLKQAGLSAGSATLGAMCVLMAVGQLQ